MNRIHSDVYLHLVRRKCLKAAPFFIRSSGMGGPNSGTSSDLVTAILQTGMVTERENNRGGGGGWGDMRICEVIEMTVYIILAIRQYGDSMINGDSMIIKILFSGSKIARNLRKRLKHSAFSIINGSSTNSFDK